MYWNQNCDDGYTRSSLVISKTIKQHQKTLFQMLALVLTVSSQV